LDVTIYDFHFSAVVGLIDQQHKYNSNLFIYMTQTAPFCHSSFK